jgi:hypothetical protein
MIQILLQDCHRKTTLTEETKKMNIPIDKSINYIQVPDRSGNVPNQWPNVQTMLNSTTIVTNIGCERIKASVGLTMMANLPTRLINITKAVDEKKYPTAVLRTLALGILLHPKGRLACIAFDIASEVLNFSSSTSQKSMKFYPSVLKKIDSMDLATACKVFSISTEKAENLEVIEKRYVFLIDSLKKTQSKLSAYMKQELQIQIDYVHSAYSTLVEHARLFPQEKLNVPTAAVPYDLEEID